MSTLKIKVSHSLSTLKGLFAFFPNLQTPFQLLLYALYVSTTGSLWLATLIVSFIELKDNFLNN